MAFLGHQLLVAPWERSVSSSRVSLVKVLERADLPWQRLGWLSLGNIAVSCPGPEPVQGGALASPRLAPKRLLFLRVANLDEPQGCAWLAAIAQLDAPRQSTICDQLDNLRTFRLR